MRDDAKDLDMGGCSCQDGEISNAPAGEKCCNTW